MCFYSLKHKLNYFIMLLLYYLLYHNIFRSHRGVVHNVVYSEEMIYFENNLLNKNNKYTNILLLHLL